MEHTRSYHLVRVVGSGGMACVYEATARNEAGFERRVALKRILAEYEDNAGLRRMFEDEAHIASHLYHGGVVQVLDYGFLEDGGFLVLEYIDGIDADKAAVEAKRLDRPIPLGVAFHLISEVGQALDYVHHATDKDGRALGIVHRDVSPSNVLLAWSGDVKLSDFGVAYALHKKEKTQTGAMRGKLSYMAPEQARHLPLSGAADVYALGVTLHSILVGSPPLSGPEAIVHTAGGAPLKADESLPAGARALFAACTQIDADARPSMAEVAERAGRLAARLIEGSPRAALCAWLEQLRAPLTKMPPLDEMMGLVLLQDAGAERRFSMARADEATVDRPVENTSTRTKPTVRGPAEEGRVQADSLLPTLPTRWPSLAIFGVAASALLGIGLAAFALLGPGDEPPPPSTDAGLAAPPIVDSGEVEEPASASADASTQDASIQEAAAFDASPSAGRRRPVRHRPRRDAGGGPVPEALAPPVTPSERGWIRVGGGGAYGQRVELDGRPIGFAPLQRAIPTGRHVVVVRDPETSTVTTRRTIVVRVSHTRSGPLPVMVEP